MVSADQSEKSKNTNTKKIERDCNDQKNTNTVGNSIEKQEEDDICNSVPVKANHSISTKCTREHPRKTKQNYDSKQKHEKRIHEHSKKNHFENFWNSQTAKTSKMLPICLHNIDIPNDFAIGNVETTDTKSSIYSNYIIDQLNNSDNTDTYNSPEYARILYMKSNTNNKMNDATYNRDFNFRYNSDLYKNRINKNKKRLHDATLNERRMTRHKSDEGVLNYAITSDNYSTDNINQDYEITADNGEYVNNNSEKRSQMSDNNNPKEESQKNDNNIPEENSQLSNGNNSDDDSQMGDNNINDKDSQRNDDSSDEDSQTSDDSSDEGSQISDTISELDLDNRLNSEISDSLNQNLNRNNLEYKINPASSSNLNSDSETDVESIFETNNNDNNNDNDNNDNYDDNGGDSPSTIATTISSASSQATNSSLDLVEDLDYYFEFTDSSQEEYEYEITSDGSSQEIENSDSDDFEIINLETGLVIGASDIVRESRLENNVLYINYFRASHRPDNQDNNQNNNQDSNQNINPDISQNESEEEDEYFGEDESENEEDRQLREELFNSNRGSHLDRVLELMQRDLEYSRDLNVFQFLN